MFGAASSTFGGFGQGNTTNTSNTGSGTFGNFNSANPTSSTGFGQTQQTTPNAFGTFGNSSQNSGFGGFGSSSQPPQTSSGFGFGQSGASAPTFGATTGSLFGNSNNVAASFGSQQPGNLFSSAASNNNSSSFGSGLFGTQNAAQLANGTAHPPFSVISEKEGTGTGTNHFQSITCMPAYSAASFEELRYQDYNQNRRYGTSAPSGFGTNTFGSTPQASSIFGQAQSSPFNQSSTTSIFGQNNTPNNGNVFGTQAPSTTGFGQPAQSGGLFANSTPSNNTGLFGNTATPTNNVFGSTATGQSMFGQTSNTAPFGQAANTNPNNSSSAFGSNASASKPFSFGAATTPFGQTTTPQTNNIFGASPATNNPPTSGNAFGQNTTSTGSLFGQNNATTPSTTFSFGNTASAPATSGNTFTFGNNSSQPAATVQKPFTFGNTPATNTFGNTDANSSKPFQFGTPAATTTANGSFGQINGVTSAPSSNLFGQPQSSSLFGNNTTSAGSNGSLFGKPANGSTNLFGTTMNNSTSLFGQQPNTSGALSFGLPTTTQNGSSIQPQQSLQASLNSSAYGTHPLFSSLQSPGQNTLPAAKPLVSNSNRKKPASLPHFRLTPRSPAASPRPQTQMHAINSPRQTPQQRNTLNFFDEDILLRPDAFSPRQNLKRLVIDRTNESSEQSSDVLETILPPTAESSRNIKQDGGSKVVHEHSKEKQIGSLEKRTEDAQTEYWSSPSFADLDTRSKVELKKIENFKVGRHGFGQISFLEPVDLSEIENIEDIPGKTIVFGEKMCIVYPDEALKPPSGKGLNVAAKVSLEKCFPLSKDKRLPIKDPEHPRVQQHIDRLRRIEGTEFQDYMAETGTWVFKAKHF